MLPCSNAYVTRNVKDAMKYFGDSVFLAMQNTACRIYYFTKLTLSYRTIVFPQVFMKQVLPAKCKGLQ